MSRTQQQQMAAQLCDDDDGNETGMKTKQGDQDALHI
jgi:hypothetical protein